MPDETPRLDEVSVITRRMEPPPGPATPAQSASQSAPARMPDAWAGLSQWTPARVALGRAGGSIPTAALLDFQLAHARARDAVHAAFEPQTLQKQIEALSYEAIVVHSSAPDRESYLRRPDLGRRLSSASRERLQTVLSGHPFDLALIASDGLSALAVHRQVVPTLAALQPLLRAAEWRVAPVVIAVNGRVALQDEIGEALGATLAVMLIGERPGLAAPDSLGAYLVYAPRAGKTDADRNCVSNIRPEGLAPERAAHKLYYLLTQARHHQLSGVQLKDESDLRQLEKPAS